MVVRIGLKGGVKFENNNEEREASMLYLHVSALPSLPT